MRHEASQSAFLHTQLYLSTNLDHILYLATFLGTNSLSVLMCRKAVNQSIVLTCSCSHSLSLALTGTYRSKLGRFDICCSTNWSVESTSSLTHSLTRIIFCCYLCFRICSANTSENSTRTRTDAGKVFVGEQGWFRQSVKPPISQRRFVSFDAVCRCMFRLILVQF